MAHPVAAGPFYFFSLCPARAAAASWSGDWTSFSSKAYGVLSSSCLYSNSCSAADQVPQLRGYCCFVGWLVGNAVAVLAPFATSSSRHSDVTVFICAKKTTRHDASNMPGEASARRLKEAV